MPQQGMAKVKLGMTKSEVRGKLGRPRKASGGRNDFGRFTLYRYKRGLRVYFQSGSTVTSMRTTHPRERTREGIGVGSKEKRLRDKYPKIKCRTLVRSRTCYLGELTPGERVTEFQIRSKKVRWITIGFVLD